MGWGFTEVDRLKDNAMAAPQSLTGEAPAHRQALGLFTDLESMRDQECLKQLQPCLRLGLTSRLEKPTGSVTSAEPAGIFELSHR